MPTTSGDEPEPAAAIADTLRRLIIQPSTFTGNGDFKAWLNKFNRIAKVNGWDEEKRLDFLSVYLDGTADEVYRDLDDNEKGDWDTLTSNLEKRFDPAPCLDVFETELCTRKRAEGEKLSDLGNAIRTLARKAYPTEKAETRDRLARTQFVRALNEPEIQLKIRLAEPKTLNQAIKYEITVEDIQATAVRPGRNPQNVARVEEDNQAWEMKEALQRNNVLMEQMVTLMKDMKSSPQQQNSGQRRYNRSSDGCWECGGDHFRRDCPKYQSGKPKNAGNRG